MRTQIGWVVLLALVACKSKSEPPAEQRPEPTPASGGPGGPAEGSGSAPPNVATPIGGEDSGTIHQPKSGPRRKEAPPSDPAPATPTPAKPDDDVKPAQAQTEKPPSGFDSLGANGGSAPPGDRRLPPGTIGFTRITALDVSSLDAADAGAKVKTAYQASLKRCYLVYLANHPAAKGSAKLTFTVGAAGIVIESAATSFAPELDACLANVAASWRFGVPTDPKTANPAPVRFAVELAFGPG